MKKEARKLGQEKGKKPNNVFLREVFKNKIKEYKRKCRTSRKSFWNDKLEKIENSLNDPKKIWNTWKHCSEINTNKKDLDFKGQNLFDHFSNLYSGNNHSNNHLSNNIQISEENKTINKPLTKNELLEAIKKLKKGKSNGYDNITNEMIINTPNNVIDIILDFINLCIGKSLITKALCYDIITLIHKSGDKWDLDNYRAICISSAILKLIMSMICSRFQVTVDKNDLISKNQIGFRNQSRTSDHILTLKRIVKNYVTIGKKKNYTFALLT